MIQPICRDVFFLSRPSRPAQIQDSTIGADLLDTLKANQERCVGMAANMIGVPKAIIVVNLGMMDLIMFNPVILKKKHPYETEEGCLSLSGTRKTTRYREIQVEFQDMEFKKQKQTFKDFTAEIIQHEVDHLQGIVI